MNDNTIESMLEKLKGSITVNQDLKKEMRQAFKPRRKHGLLKRFAAMAAAAALTLAVFYAFNDRFVEVVSAASLKISNYVSLVDLGGGENLGIAEHEGVIYTPVFGKGLYSYDKTGYHKLYDKEVNFASISRDGQKLAMASGGTLQIYDIKSGTVTDLLKPDNQDTYYEQPSWSGDGKKIIFTKKVIEFRETHGFEEKESGIYEVQLDTKTVSKITHGSFPSYIAGKDAVIFERDNNIIVRSLRDGSEYFIDSGGFPSASPDGNYAVYVKTEDNVKVADADKNAKIQESVTNVWIADTAGSGSKKKVTNNFPQEPMDVEEWLVSLKPSDIPQVLLCSGKYYYYNPVWSSDSNSIYVLKNAEQSMRLTRIDFAQEQLSREDTVKSFIQALIMRDDDYAKSLMELPPEILTISNPKVVGLKIISKGEEGARSYVDAESYLQYTANPYYQTEGSRYYLTESEAGFKIDEIKRLYSEEVYSRDDGVVYYSKTEGEAGSKSQETVLLSSSDIPSQYLPEGQYRISSLYYNGKLGSLVFTLQGLEENSTLKVLSYNRFSRKFKLIGSIDGAAGYFLTADNDFKYAALDYYYANDYEKPRTNVYSLDGKSEVSLYSLLEDMDIDSMKSSYWDNSRLVFEVGKEGQWARFIYYPDKKTMEIF